MPLGVKSSLSSEERRRGSSVYFRAPLLDFSTAESDESPTFCPPISDTVHRTRS
jgi:hypothetical protein